MLTHLSLFSGYGGLDIAAHWAGFETVAMVEWAEYPHSLLAKRFPKAALFRDIREFNAEVFYEATGLRTVDIISGGFPCQPFSVAGQRRGSEDDRYLWPEMLRTVEELRPRWVIGENVAGIASMAEPTGRLKVESSTRDANEAYSFYEAVLVRQDDAVLRKIIADLENLDYTVQCFIIPACAANAKHRRDRIFIAGYTEYHGPSAAAE